MTYSMDFRRSVAAAYDQCGSSLEVAETFGCSESWVRRLMQRYRQWGTLEPIKPARRSQRCYDEADDLAIRALIKRKPDATLREVAEAIGKPIHPGNVSRALARLNLPRKKSPRTLRSKTGRM